LSKLGLFGMGFNVATARLGQMTTLLSTREGDPEWVGVEIDLQTLRGGFRVPVIRRPKRSPDEHGTRVEVTGLAQLAIDLGRSQKQRYLRDRLGGVYSYLLEAEEFVGDANGPGPDLALLEIDDPAVDLPPIGLARVDRDGATDDPVDRCHAIGYPWFAETPSPTAVRDTVDAIGVVPVLSKLAAGLLSVQVSISPRPLPPEDKSLAASEARRDRK
jgi:hypothetical protein